MGQRYTVWDNVVETQDNLQKLSVFWVRLLPIGYKIDTTNKQMDISDDALG